MGRGGKCVQGWFPLRGGPFAWTVPYKLVLLFLVSCTPARGDPWAGAAPSSQPGQDQVPTAPLKREAFQNTGSFHPGWSRDVARTPRPLMNLMITSKNIVYIKCKLSGLSRCLSSLGLI